MMADVKTIREQTTMLRYTSVAYLVCTSYKKIMTLHTTEAKS